MANRESYTTGTPEGEAIGLEGLPILRDIGHMIPQAKIEPMELEFACDEALEGLREGAALDSISEGAEPLQKIFRI